MPVLPAVSRLLERYCPGLHLLRRAALADVLRDPITLVLRTTGADDDLVVGRARAWVAAIDDNLRDVPLLRNRRLRQSGAGRNGRARRQGWSTACSLTHRFLSKVNSG